MPERYLTLDDLQNADSPKNIAAIFQKLGYNAAAEPLNVEELELPAQSSRAVEGAYLIVNEGNRRLQVLLFQLRADKLNTPSVIKRWMRAIAQSLCRRSSHVLLIGTKDYKKLILLSMRQSFNDRMHLKLLIEVWRLNRTNPTYHDRTRLEAFAVGNLEFQTIHKVQDEALKIPSELESDRLNLRGTEDSLRLYLQEVARIPRLRAEQKIELGISMADLLALERIQERLCAQLGRKPDESEWAEAVNVPLPELRRRLNEGRKAKNKMVESNLRLVVSTARKYQNQGLDLLDLIQEGNIGLIRAADKFDPKEGNRFSRYASLWIHQIIKRAIANYSRSVRLPVHLWQKIIWINKTSEQLCQELGRQPTEAELVKYLQIEPEQLQAVFDYFRPIISLDTRIGEEEDSRLADLIECNGETQSDYLLTLIEQEYVKTLLETLSPQEREVLSWRFGLDGDREKSFSEIGSLYHMSRERVRQIEVRALKKLRNLITREKTVGVKVFAQEERHRKAIAKRRFRPRYS